MQQNYYQNQGSAKRLRKKLDLLRDIKKEIDTLQVNMRFEDEKEALQSRIDDLQRRYNQLNKEVV